MRYGMFTPLSPLRLQKSRGPVARRPTVTPLCSHPEIEWLQSVVIHPDGVAIPRRITFALNAAAGAVTFLRFRVAKGD
eukprot:1725886-Pyramimonas_sp.AAC.1